MPILVFHVVTASLDAKLLVIKIVFSNICTNFLLLSSARELVRQPLLIILLQVLNACSSAT